MNEAKPSFFTKGEYTKLTSEGVVYYKLDDIWYRESEHGGLVLFGENAYFDSLILEIPCSTTPPPELGIGLDEGTFPHALMNLINYHSIEGGSDTPDYLLAIFLVSCLDAFDRVTRMRDEKHPPMKDFKVKE